MKLLKSHKISKTYHLIQQLTINDAVNEVYKIKSISRTSTRLKTIKSFAPHITEEIKRNIKN